MSEQMPTTLDGPTGAFEIYTILTVDQWVTSSGSHFNKINKVVAIRKTFHIPGPQIEVTCNNHPVPTRRI